MSYTKRLIEIYDKESRIQNLVELLYNNKYINDSRCQGIARQIITKGTTSLSNKQKYLYKKDVEPSFDSEIVNCAYCYADLLKTQAYYYIKYDYNEGTYWCSKECYEANIRSKCGD